MKVLCTLAILCALLALAFTRPSDELTKVTTTTEEVPGVGGLKPSQCRPAPHRTVNTTRYNMMELCQRCVKYTLNVEVFFLCCSNQDDVQIWCVQAHEFGRSPHQIKNEKKTMEIEETGPFGKFL